MLDKVQLDWTAWVSGKVLGESIAEAPGGELFVVLSVMTVANTSGDGAVDVWFGGRGWLWRGADQGSIGAYEIGAGATDAGEDHQSW